MTELGLLAIIVIGAAAGGALGAYLAKAPAWQGGVTAGAASVVQSLVVEAADIQQPILQTLIYLILVGLIGGRWGFGFGGRQLMQVVLGSFLIPIIVALVALYAG